MPPPRGNPFGSLSARQAAQARTNAAQRGLRIQFRQALLPPTRRPGPNYVPPSPTVPDPFTVDKPHLGQSPKGFDRTSRLPHHLSQGTEADARSRARSFLVNPAQTSGRPKTPRTLRYAYNAASKELRVIFRDGTPWVYEDVSPSMARDLRRSQSVGQFIIRRLDPRGPATYRPGNFNAGDQYLGVFEDDNQE